MSEVSNFISFLLKTTQEVAFIYLFIYSSCYLFILHFGSYPAVHRANLHCKASALYYLAGPWYDFYYLFHLYRKETKTDKLILKSSLTPLHTGCQNDGNNRDVADLIVNLSKLTLPDPHLSQQANGNIDLAMDERSNYRLLKTKRTEGLVCLFGSRMICVKHS